MLKYIQYKNQGLDIKGLIIAAGRGKRLGNFTDDVPKPLVDIHGNSFFQNTFEHFNSLGIDNIGAIVGYKKEQFHKFNKITFFNNNNWKNNNILHSLFCAKDFMDDDMIIAYSDIWFNKEPIERIINSKDDFVIAVDDQWHEYYEGRSEHPVSEAENVHYDDNLSLKKIGKHISDSDNKKCHVGEFMGLLKISKKIIKEIVTEFEYLQKTLNLTMPFYNAQEFQKAYLTDFITYLMSKSYDIKCSVNHRNWFEIDTVQDLQNLKKLLKNQKKVNIVRQ